MEHGYRLPASSRGTVIISTIRWLFAWPAEMSYLQEAEPRLLGTIPLPSRPEAVIADTPFGRIGFAICADMIYRKVWEGYRDQIDLAIISAAWPEFACRETGQRHWLFGHVGPLAGAIPAAVAKDLGIPVVFANQTGHTRTTIPFVGTWITEKIADRFAGQSCIADGHHGQARLAGWTEEVLLSEITLHPQRGPRTWRSTSPSVFAGSSSVSEPSGSAFSAVSSTVETIGVEWPLTTLGLKTSGPTPTSPDCRAPRF